MTNFALDASSTGRRTDRRSLHPLLILYPAVLVAAAGGAASMARVQGDIGGMEDSLVLLLRFMAGMKALTVLGAVALTHWRFLQPVGLPMAFGYATALGLMAVAPGLIASLQHIAVGAGLFHAGLLLFLVLALRDDGIAGMARRRLPVLMRR